MSSQAGITSWRAVSSASGGITPSSFWRAKVRSRSASQPSSNWPAYLSAHSLGTWCGAWVAPGAKYMKNGLSGDQRLLLAHPGDRVVGQVLGQVVALLRACPGGSTAVVPSQQGRVVLVGLAAEEAVEVLEPVARGRPAVERPGRAGLPHRHLVALAERARCVAVQLEDLGQRRAACSGASSCSRAPRWPSR